MKDTTGSRIKEARKAAGYSQAALGKLINVDQSTVALWETDRTVPRQDKINELAKVLFLSAEFLHYGNSGVASGDGMRTVPVVGYVGAANEVHPFHGGIMQETPSPPTVDKEAPQASAAIIVRGNAMWPVYRDGDILYYADELKQKPAGLLGTECVVQIQDGATVVKRLMSGSRRGTFTLASYNAPEMRDVSVEWAAPIVWIRRNLNQPAE